MDQSTKDIFEVLSWVAAVLAGIVAAGIAIYQMVLNRRQRSEELRWQQANAAKDLLNTIFNDPYFRNAMIMLDWSGRPFETKPGKWEQIKISDVLSALRTRQLSFEDKEVFIRDCFDHVFDAFERLEHFIRINVVHFSDVEFEFGYYAKKLSEQREVFNNFLSQYGYKLALMFLSRFEEWSWA
ncbi:MAG: hypothetical protein WBD99_01970 [Thermodesulfobacteriota bacterium]